MPLIEHKLAQVPLAVLVKAAFVTEEGTHVPILPVCAVPWVDGDQLLDPVRADVLVGTGVDVSTHSLVLDEAGASSLGLVAAACDDALLDLTVVGAAGDMSTAHGANGDISSAYRGDGSRSADSSDRGNVVFAIMRNHAVNGTKDSVMDARGTDDGLDIAQGGQGISSGEAIRRAHDMAGATSHHEVESSKDDIAVVHNVGGDLSGAHGGDGSGGADGDVEADEAFGAAKNPTVECMIVDIGAVHEADAAPVESAAPPIPHSAQSAANMAPGGLWEENPRSVSPVTAEPGLGQERRASPSRQRPAKPQSSPTACFGPETLVRVATACTPGDWTRKKIKHITPDDHVLGWFQENATTVVCKKVRVLCVTAFEQPVTNGVPPALTLVEGAAITPMHHVYVDCMRIQAREVATRAVRATGAPVLEVLVGDLTARY